ncbi:MAG: sulfotransferase [Anaerolineales bacterium]
MFEQRFIRKLALKNYLMQPLALGSFKNWIRLLKENKHIDSRYLGRAIYVSMVSLLFGPVRVYQRLRYQHTFESVKIRRDPIFILGHWRSGTTHLHNLLCQDRRFGYISALQVIAPDLFYVASKSFKALLRMNTPENRLMDNMSWSIDSPQEEELALGNVSPYSLNHLWSFPKNAKQYFDHYAIFKDVSSEVLEAWKENYMQVIKMATLNMHGRRLVIKNPPNTGRIPILLELFPNAKFIFLHRDPYQVFLSTRNLYNKMLPYSQLQEISNEEIDANILTFYRDLMRHYLNDRSLIPPQNLVEISYKELDERPLPVMRRIYNRLNFWPYARVRGRIRRYLKSQENYQKNSYQISREDIESVNRYWEFAFQEWRYSMRTPQVLE